MDKKFRKHSFSHDQHQSRHAKPDAQPDIINIPIPGLLPDGTWDKGVLSGRVSCGFRVDLDGDLATRLQKETAHMVFFRQWSNERKIQCLAPILWEQLKRDMDRWQRSKPDGDKPSRE